jgi:hypothetical protein
MSMLWTASGELSGWQASAEAGLVTEFNDVFIRS